MEREQVVWDILLVQVSKISLIIYLLFDLIYIFIFVLKFALLSVSMKLATVNCL